MQNDVKQMCLKHYDLYVDDIKLLQDGSDNVVYLIEAQKTNYVVRISKKQKNDDDFLFEADIIRHLFEHDIPVPTPIYNTDHSFLTTYNGQKIILFSFCKGHTAELDESHLPNALEAYNAGVVLAKIHNATENYMSAYKPSRVMNAELQRVIKAQKDFERKYEGGGEFVAQVDNILAQSINNTKQNCVIHNDFRIHNLLFKDQKISAVLDFDWSCYGCPLKDLAHTMVEWSYPDGAKQHCNEIMRQILKGYESIRTVENKNDLIYWMRFSCLSDAATYFMDRLYPLTEVKPLRSYMYKKFLYFSFQNIAELSEK